MDKKKIRLNAAGWRIGSAHDYLALSTKEAELVERMLGSRPKL